MTFDLALVLENAPNIARAFGVTLGVWAGAVVFGSIGGFAIAVARRWGPTPLGWLLRAFVEVIRGTPFLVQIFLLYYGGPFIGLSLDNIPAGMIGLSIYAAAYYSEIFRTGFAAIPKGHLEAADCAGFTRAQTLRRIVLPEMTMLVLPAMVNMTILMLKETAVLSIISVPELTLEVSAIGTAHYAFVESFTIVALLYWGLTDLCGRAGRLAEARFSRYRFSHS